MTVNYSAEKMRAAYGDLNKVVGNRDESYYALERVASYVPSALNTIDTLTAQLAAAEARVAERDAVLRAVGVPAEQVELMAWALERGFTIVSGEVCFVDFMSELNAVMNLQPDGSGDWMVGRNGENVPFYQFTNDERERAWAAFNAARSGEVQDGK